MHTVALVGAFIFAHWESIAAALVGLMSAVGTLKNWFSKHPKVEGVLDKILDVLAFVSKYGARGVPYLGRFSVPGVPSRPAAQPSLSLVPPAEEKKS